MCVCMLMCIHVCLCVNLCMFFFLICLSCCSIPLRQINSFVLFVTHYPLLAELESKYPLSVANFHMAYVEVEDSGECEYLKLDGR